MAFPSRSNISVRNKPETELRSSTLVKAFALGTLLTAGVVTGMSMQESNINAPSPTTSDVKPAPANR